MLTLAVRAQTLVMLLAGRLRARLAGLSHQRGQTSAEYALVLLGAAGVALLIAAWAKSTGKVGDLLDAIFDNIRDMVS